MTVVRATSPGGQIIATLVNYAVHPEVLGNDAGICSPDLVGPLCDTLEADVGGLALLVNGAQGGRPPPTTGNCRSRVVPSRATVKTSGSGRDASGSAV
jgi:hypothetical protein